jgi:hypothetical protein
MGAYHTSIIIGEVELFFDRNGIEFALPFASHMHEPDNHLDIDVQSFGRGKLSLSTLLMQLGPLFEAGTYDSVYKNCNAFTDVGLYFLTHQRLDSKYSRLERFVRATAPVSTGVFNGLASAVAAGDVPMAEDVDREEFDLWRLRYRANPRATNFCVEDAIAACNALNGEVGRTAKVANASLCHCEPCSMPTLNGQVVSKLPEQLPDMLEYGVQDDGRAATDFAECRSSRRRLGRAGVAPARRSAARGSTTACAASVFDAGEDIRSVRNGIGIR